jgi:hypothetical protein
MAPDQAVGPGSGRFENTTCGRSSAPPALLDRKYTHEVSSVPQLELWQPTCTATMYNSGFDIDS